MTTFTQEQFDKFSDTDSKLTKKFGGMMPKYELAEAAQKMFGFTTDESFEFLAAYTDTM